MGYTTIESVPTRVEVSIVGTDEIKLLLREYLKTRQYDNLQCRIRNHIRVPEIEHISIDLCTESQITFSFEDPGDEE